MAWKLYNKVVMIIVKRANPLPQPSHVLTTS